MPQSRTAPGCQISVIIRQCLSLRTSLGHLGIQTSPAKTCSDWRPPLISPPRGCSPKFASTFYSRRRRNDSPMQGHQRTGPTASSRLWAGLLDHEQDGAGHLGRAASLPGAGSSPRWATAGCHVLRMLASGASRAPQTLSGFTACEDWTAGMHNHNPPPPNISLQSLRGSTHPCSSAKKSSAPQLRRLTGGPACRSRWTVELRRESWDTLFQRSGLPAR